MEKNKEISEDLQTVLSKSDCFYICFNSSYDLIYASPSLFLFSGYTEETFQNECQGKISPLVHPEDLQKMKASIARQLSMGSYFKYEFRLITKSKAVRWVYLRGIMSVKDKQMVYSAIAYDITESKESYRDLLEAKNDLTSITYQLEGGILKVRAEDLKIIYANEGFYRLGGYTKADYDDRFNNYCSGVIYPEDMPVVKNAIKKILKTHGIFTVEFRIIHKDGSIRWNRCTGNFLNKEKDSSILLCVITDITESKEYENSLLLEQKKHEIICRLNNEYLWEFDFKNNVLTRNGDIEDSYSKEKTLPDGFNYFLENAVHMDDLDKAKNFHAELDNGAPNTYVDIRIKDSRGMFAWHRLQAVTINDSAGNPIRIIGKTSNIDNVIQTFESLKDEAQRDSLTHLFNREVTEKKINTCLKNITSQNYALIILDIKHCKAMQLEYGQLFTDSVIQETSARVTELFPNAVIGRTGFDIFSVFLPEIESEDKLTELVKKTINRVTSIETGQKNNVNIRCHIGISTSNEPDDTFAALFQQADMALFYAKSQDKDYEFFRKETMDREKLDIIESNIASSASSNSILRKFIWTSEDYGLMSDIMNILTNEENVPNAIHIIMEKISLYFDVGQVMITEYQPEENISKISYTYYSQDAQEPVKPLLNQPLDMLRGYEKLFNAQGIFYTNDLDSIKEYSSGMFELLRYSNICSTINCSLVRNNKFAGFLSLNDSSQKHLWNDKELNLIRSITDIINYVLIKYNKEHSSLYSRSYDTISRLPSFSSFIVEGNHMLKKVRTLNEFKKTGKKLALVSMDIRKFHYYNINYGFAIGNKVLFHMANRLQNFTEVNEICTRLHADLFYMLLQYDTQSSLEIRISSFLSENNTYKITMPDYSDFLISCGIYLINDVDTDLSELIDKADYARNTSKQLKEQSNYSIYSSKMEKRQDTDTDVRDHLKKALINREITILFQPKYDLLTDQISGAEALVRWNRQDGKLVFPDVILPILQQERLMADLDFYVIDEVCRTLSAIRARKKKIYPISVGLSNVHLHNPKFLEQLSEVVSSYRIPVNYIQLEIEEKTLLEEPEMMRDFLQNLKDKGFVLILSHFGSVNPSLDTLARFPMDVIKFDMGYFRKHIEEDRYKVLLQKTIESAHALGQKVAVVGLESQLQKSVLSSIGCDFIQGYLYHKPLLPEAFEKYLCADL